MVHSRIPILRTLFDKEPHKVQIPIRATKPRSRSKVYRVRKVQKVERDHSSSVSTFVSDYRRKAPLSSAQKQKQAKILFHGNKHKLPSRKKSLEEKAKERLGRIPIKGEKPKSRKKTSRDKKRARSLRAFKHKKEKRDARRSEERIEEAKRHLEKVKSRGVRRKKPVAATRTKKPTTPRAFSKGLIGTLGAGSTLYRSAPIASAYHWQMNVSPETYQKMIPSQILKLPVTRDALRHIMQADAGKSAFYAIDEKIAVIYAHQDGGMYFAGQDQPFGIIGQFVTRRALRVLHIADSADVERLLEEVPAAKRDSLRTAFLPYRGNDVTQDVAAFRVLCSTFGVDAVKATGSAAPGGAAELFVCNAAANRDIVLKQLSLSQIIGPRIQLTGLTFSTLALGEDYKK
jgi:hypothetical protein